MHDIVQTISGVIAGLIGLAILAVLVSRNANTAGVIGTAAQGLAADIGAATSPVSGMGMGGFGLSGLGMGGFITPSFNGGF